MRVIRVRAKLRERLILHRRRDDGAVLIIVAAFSLVAILFAAFVIDIGNQRQNRRQLTTSTDSVSLAVAQEWVDDGADPAFDCDDPAVTIDDTLAASNNPDGDAPPDYECTFTDVVPFRGGVVTVASRGVADFAFEGVTGIAAGRTNSLTSVRVEPVVGGGLRPIAVCDVNVPTDTWTAAPDDPTVLFPPAGLSLPIVLTNTFGGPPTAGIDEACTEAGNWGQVEFGTGPGNPADANDFNDQIENGSPVPVAVNEVIDSFTGVGGFNSSAMNALEGETFFIPIYDRRTPGTGTNSNYYVSGFLEVFLEEYVGGGSTHTFTFLPLRFVTDGPCCLVNPANAEVTVCDVGTIGGDPDQQMASNCALRSLPSSPTPPPPLPDPCSVTSVLPLSQVAVLSGPGANGNLTSSVTYTVMVEDDADCAGLSAQLKLSSPPASSVDAAVELVAPLTYSITVSSGTTLRKGSTYSVQIIQGAAVRNDAAVLQTI